MAYQKKYQTTIPIPRDEPVDGDVVVWLTRESFNRAAEADALTIVQFNDLGEVAAEDIPPKVEEQLGRPVWDFCWRSFEGIGERPSA